MSKAPTATTMLERAVAAGIAGTVVMTTFQNSVQRPIPGHLRHNGACLAIVDTLAGRQPGVGVARKRLLHGRDPHVVPRSSRHSPPLVRKSRLQQLPGQPDCGPAFRTDFHRRVEGSPEVVLSGPLSMGPSFRVPVDTGTAAPRGRPTRCAGRRPERRGCARARIPEPGGWRRPGRLAWGCRG